MVIHSFMAIVAAARSLTVSSPDGRIRAQVDPPISGGSPRWSVMFRGKPLMTDCRLGLDLAGMGDVMAGSRLVETKRADVDQRIPVQFGRAKSASNHYREVRFTLANPSGVHVNVVFRCYDDAVAFRYEVPKQAGLDRLVVRDETTSFGVAGNPTVYAQYLESFHTSHEHNVDTVACGAIRPDALLDTPLTLRWKDGTYAAITEAALRHYAGMSLR